MQTLQCFDGVGWATRTAFSQQNNSAPTFPYNLDWLRKKWAGKTKTENSDSNNSNKLCGRPPQYATAPCKLIFDLLTLKVVSESRVTWATSVSILVFLVFLDLGPMYATDRQTSDRQMSDRQTSNAQNRLVPSPYRGGGIIMYGECKWGIYFIFDSILTTVHLLID